MPVTRATLVDPAALAPEGWDDPTRGPIRWRTLLDGSATPTDAFTCGIAELSAGDWFAEHRHAEPEIYFGVAGEFDVMVDGVAHRMAPERVLYVPGDALHGIPPVAGPVRFLYAFATDTFAGIDYRFPHEGR